MSRRNPRLALLSTLLLSLATGIAAAGDVKVYRTNEIVDPLEVVRILEGSARPSAAVRADDPHAIRSRSIRLFDDPSAPPLAGKTQAAGASTAAHTSAAAAAPALPQLQPNTTPPARRADAAQQPHDDVEVHAAAAGDITRRDTQRAGGGTSVLSLPVQFAFDSADILPAARAQLDALAEGVRLLPDSTRVVIEGHTDAAGRDDYNQQLSLRRAQSVKRYLVAAHGIDPARLRALGLGEYAPLVGLTATAPEHRRVQFRGER